jgi:hypothetical protein
MQKQINSASKSDEIELLSSFITPASLQLLKGSGTDLIGQIGLDIFRGIILDILTGKNLRDSTESLTRRRITALNLAIVSLFVKGSSKSADFASKLPYLASDILAHKSLPKFERWLAQWMLGLTDKAVQNVLRDDIALLLRYRDSYIQTCKEIIDNHRQVYGELTGGIKLGEEAETQVDWLLMTYLLNAIGSLTLTIRGSEKSTFGKLFEKLVLGSLLSIFGFKHETPHKIGERVFWLSSQDEKRESDATLLYEIGKGVRFDIGFIGRGNPEISLDKVTRFQHEEILEGKRFYMATIIIVDRIGKNSRIVEMARAVNGSIVQMSATYWPQQVARLLKNALGFEHELMDMDQTKIEDYLREKLSTVPLTSFIRNLQVEDLPEIEAIPLFEESDMAPDDELTEEDT